MNYSYLEDKIKTSKKEFDCFDFVKYFYDLESLEFDLKEIDTPQDFCVVLAGKNFEHAGIYYKNNIIHTSYNKEISIQNINSFKNLYKKVKYYKIDK